MNNLRDSYKFYKSNVEDPIDIKTYLKIVNSFMKFIMSKIFKGFEVKLPARLGSFSIIGKKIKPRLNSEGEIANLAPNWVKTKELWENNPEAKKNKELVYCFNEHTGGVRYKFLWSKKNVNVVNKNLYSIKFSRANKRMLNTMIEQGKEFIVLN